MRKKQDVQIKKNKKNKTQTNKTKAREDSTTEELAGAAGKTPGCKACDLAKESILLPPC